MTRRQEIETAALRVHNDDDIHRFVAGAEWADENPDEKLQDLVDSLQWKLKVATQFIQGIKFNYDKESEHMSKILSEIE